MKRWLLILLFSGSAFASCLTVSASGSGAATGADWSNTLNGANLASLVARNNTYYLSGGAYNFTNTNQTFSTADSGTQAITIRAATSADHGSGSGCGQTGWSGGMAASGANQVVFRCSNCLSGTFNYQMRFLTDYWILDGNDPARTTASDSSAAYNMAVDNSWRGGASDGSGLGFHVMLGATGSPVHDITINYIEYKGTGLDSMNVDPQAIAHISCSANVATIQLAGQRNHAYLFVGEWVTIGGTASHAKDTADTLTAGPQQIGSTTNGQMVSCTNASSTTAVCTMVNYVPTISTDGTQNVIIASNSVSNYNGTWPVTAINFAAKTISFTLGTSGNGTGTGGNATWNGSIGVQIQSVTQGAAVCAPGVSCSDDWTQSFTVSGNGYTCSGGAETTGVLSGPDAEGGGGIDLVAGVTNGTFNYSYGHDFLGLWDIGGDTNITIQGNACERLEAHSISPFHSSCLAGDSTTTSSSGTDGLTFAYNLIMDTEGSGDVGTLYRNGSPPTSNNWNIYGNVFGYSNGDPYQRNSNGIGNVFCQTTVICTNWTILNNTVVGDGAPENTHWGFVQSSTPTLSNIVCENNLAYNATQQNGAFGISLCTSEDHNTYVNLGANAPSLGTADFAVTGSDPFMADISHNYALSGEAVFSHLNDGVSTNSLLPANTTDPAGNTRGADGTWERGSYEFFLGSTPTAWKGFTASGVTMK
jgi:hypothetical protein